MAGAASIENYWGRKGCCVGREKVSSGRGADREWRSGHNFNFLVITFSLRRPSLSDGGASVDKPAGAAHLVGEGGSGFVAWKRVLAFEACVLVDAVAPAVVETWSEL